MQVLFSLRKSFEKFVDQMFELETWLFELNFWIKLTIFRPSKLLEALPKIQAANNYKF